jgi:hypothetical protein
MSRRLNRNINLATHHGARFFYDIDQIYNKLWGDNYFVVFIFCRANIDICHYHLINHPPTNKLANP